MGRAGWDTGSVLSRMARASRICPCWKRSDASAGNRWPQLVSVLRQYAPSWLVQMPALVPPRSGRRSSTREATRPTRMLRELTEALDALTTECPLVLVLEDLHWSDRATLEWLAYVARRPDPARLLILGTYRPVDVMVHAHPLRTVLTELQQHGQCAELALDYLSDVEVTAYLHQRFGHAGLAADLAPVLHQRTQGNPLFVIAVVDELIRHQVVREGPAGWAMRGGVEALSTIVPATLRALLEQQLAHCSREEQTLLAAASVAGVEFAAAAVAAGLSAARTRLRPMRDAGAPRAVPPGAWPCRMAGWDGHRVLWLSPCPVSRSLVSAHPGGTPDPVACPDWGTPGAGLRRAGR